MNRSVADVRWPHARHRTAIEPSSVIVYAKPTLRREFYANDHQELGEVEESVEHSCPELEAVNRHSLVNPMEHAGEVELRR